MQRSIKAIRGKIRPTNAIWCQNINAPKIYMHIIPKLLATPSKTEKDPLSSAFTISTVYTEVERKPLPTPTSSLVLAFLSKIKQHISTLKYTTMISFVNNLRRQQLSKQPYMVDR